MELSEMFERERWLRQRFHRDADQQQLVVVLGDRCCLQATATGAPLDQYPLSVP